MKETNGYNGQTILWNVNNAPAPILIPISILKYAMNGNAGTAGMEEIVMKSVGSVGYYATVSLTNTNLLLNLMLTNTGASFANGQIQSSGYPIRCVAVN